MSYDIGEVKKILRSILVSVQSGMSVHELEKSFLEIEGRNIPYHEFGFSNVIEFLSSIPETLRVSVRTEKKSFDGLNFVFCLVYYLKNKGKSSFQFAQCTYI